MNSFTEIDSSSLVRDFVLVDIWSCRSAHNPLHVRCSFHMVFSKDSDALVLEPRLKRIEGIQFRDDLLPSLDPGKETIVLPNFIPSFVEVHNFNVKRSRPLQVCLE